MLEGQIVIKDASGDLQVYTSGVDTQTMLTSSHLVKQIRHQIPFAYGKDYKAQPLKYFHTNTQLPISILAALSLNSYQFQLLWVPKRLLRLDFRAELLHGVRRGVLPRE